MKTTPLLSSIAILSLIALLSSGFTVAETIKIPVGQQAEDKQQIDRPEKGMHQEKVKAIFGDPQEIREARGEPPISSWVYEDYVVYFESQYVIHTVLRK